MCDLASVELRRNETKHTGVDCVSFVFPEQKMFVKTIDALPPSESKLDKIVIQLVEVEKELGPRHNKVRANE